MKNGVQIGFEIERTYVDYIGKCGEDPKRLLISAIDLVTYKIYLDNIIGHRLGDISKYRGCEIIECVTLEIPIFTN